MAKSVKNAELADAEQQLHEKAARWEQLELEHASVTSELSAAQTEQQELLEGVEHLKHHHVAGGGIRQNLETELRLLNDGLGKMRNEHDDFSSNNAEMRDRLSLLIPTLAEARRKVRDLEKRRDAAVQAASREQQLHEKLEREIGMCHQNIRSIHNQNVALSERCTELEAHLMSRNAGQKLIPRSVPSSIAASGPPSVERGRPVQLSTSSSESLWHSRGCAGNNLQSSVPGGYAAAGQQVVPTPFYCVAAEPQVASLPTALGVAEEPDYYVAAEPQVAYVAALVSEEPENSEEPD
jgi:hypothetical protein